MSKAAGLRIAVFCCCVLPLLVVGCRAVRPSSAGIMVESYPHNRIKVNGKVFGEHFRITQCAAAKSEEGRLRATVSLENLKEACQFQYRYRWLDKDGIEVRSNTSIWESMSAGARETKLLTGVAPELRVEDYVLDVRFTFGSTRW